MCFLDKFTKKYIVFLGVILLYFIFGAVSVQGATIVSSSNYWCGSGNPNTKSHTINIPSGYVNCVAHVSNGSGNAIISCGTGNIAVTSGGRFTFSVGAIGGPGYATVYVTGDLPHTHSYSWTSFNVPVITWNNDYTAVYSQTGSQKCSCGRTQSATYVSKAKCTVTSTIVEWPTYESTGLRQYTATATSKSKTATAMKEEILPKLEYVSELDTITNLDVKPNKARSMSVVATPKLDNVVQDVDYSWEVLRKSKWISVDEVEGFEGNHTSTLTYTPSNFDVNLQKIRCLIITELVDVKGGESTVCETYTQEVDIWDGLYSRCEVTANAQYAYYVSMPASLTLEPSNIENAFISEYTVKAKMKSNGLAGKYIQVKPLAKGYLEDKNDSENRIPLEIQQDKIWFGTENTGQVEQLFTDKWSSIKGIVKARTPKAGIYTGNFNFEYGIVNI